MNGRTRRIGAAVVVAAAAAVGWMLRPETATTEVLETTAASATAVGTRGVARTGRVRAKEPADDAAAQAAATEWKPAPILARVRVTSRADGSPVAGAQLELSDDSQQGERISLVTGSDGTARMAQGREWSDLVVVARAKGFVGLRSGFRSSELADELSVRLIPGRAIAGRVVDDVTGDPIAGANVGAGGADNYFGMSHEAVALEVDSATSDAAGAFVLQGFPVPQHGMYGQASAGGHRIAYFTCDPDSTEPIVVRLEPAGRVRGVVRGPDGTPVARAQVVAEQREYVSFEESRSAASTAADGTFVIDGLRLGVAYDLDCPMAAPVDWFVTSPRAPEAVRDFVLRRPASLTVMVVCTDGSTAPSAKVTVGRAGRSDWESLVDAGPDGTHLDDVEPGAVTVHAWSDDSADTTSDVTLAEGEAKRITIALRPEFATEGVVVDETGAPIAGATIGADDQFGCGREEHPEATSDSGGTFRLLTRTNGERSIAVEAAAHLGASVKATPGGGSARVVLLRLAPVEFRIRTADGSGVRKFSYVLLDEQGAEILHGGVGLDSDITYWKIEAPLSARQLRLDVRNCVATVLAVRPVLGKTTDLGTITLDRGAAVVGRILACDAATLDGEVAAVYSADGASHIATARLGPDGEFDVHGLAPQRVLIRFRHGGYLDPAAAAEARVDPTPITITLRQGCLLRLRVVDADGLAALKARVDALAADGTPVPDGLDEKFKPGCYESRLPPGRWRLVATRGDLRAEETVDVTEGTTRELTLRLGR